MTDKKPKKREEKEITLDQLKVEGVSPPKEEPKTVEGAKSPTCHRCKFYAKDSNRRGICKKTGKHTARKNKCKKFDRK